MAAATFDQIGAALKADPSLGKKVGGVLCFVIGDATFTVDCKKSVVEKGAGTKADCTLTLSEADFLAMASGKLTGMAAFMGGKLKLKGNMAMAQKFNALTDAAKKMGAAPAAAAAAAPAASGFASAAVFDEIGANLKADPGLAKKVNGVFQFNVTGGPGGATASWTVDAKGAGGVSQKAAAKADCTITMSDADFVAMAQGKLTGMAAFMGGKMKIKGNMALAQKFSALADAKKSKL